MAPADQSCACVGLVAKMARAITVRLCEAGQNFLVYCRYRLGPQNLEHCPFYNIRHCDLSSMMHCTHRQAGMLLCPAAGIVAVRPAACRRPSSSLGSRRRAPALTRAAATSAAAPEQQEAQQQEVPRLDAALDDRLSQRPLSLDPAGYYIIRLDRDSRELIVDFYTNFINEQGGKYEGPARPALALPPLAPLAAQALPCCLPAFVPSHCC